MVVIYGVNDMRLIGRCSLWTRRKQVVTGIPWPSLSRNDYVKFCTTPRRLAENGPPWRIMFFGTDEFSLPHLQVLHKSMQDDNQKLMKKLEVTVADEKVSNNLLNLLWVDSKTSTLAITVIASHGRSVTPFKARKSSDISHFGVLFFE